jgi:hypothetical protein
MSPKNRRSTRHTPPAIPAGNDDDQVLSVPQWCALNSLSLRTGRRILASKDRPRITQLSERRIGIRRIDNRRWVESRAR